MVVQRGSAVTGYAAPGCWPEATSGHITRSGVAYGISSVILPTMLPISALLLLSFASAAVQGALLLHTVTIHNAHHNLNRGSCRQ
jgi:hypothetical protein